MANTEQARNEQYGGIIGLGAGVITGAEVGTFILPIPVVGTFVGALFGGVLGTKVGQRVGGVALNGLNSMLDTLIPPTRGDRGSDTPNPEVKK